MSRLERRHIGKGLLVLAALALLGWLVPTFLSAGRYRHRLETGLGEALGRPVRFGAISLHILPRPGFTVENVVVGEDPSFGLEPFAHVERADCALAWSSLLNSRLTCSEVTLEGAVINLVRTSPGKWNIATLLHRGGAALTRATKSPGPPRALRIAVNDSRLDFVFNGVKTPMAITDLRAQLALAPETGAVQFRVSGSPLRGDLPVAASGHVRFSGEWQPEAPPSRRLKATLAIGNAQVGSWTSLLTGENPNVYGVLNGTSKVTGSWTRIQLAGHAQFAELHQMSQPPPRTDMPVAVHFHCLLDRAEGRLLIESAGVFFGRSSLHLSGGIENISVTPDFDLVLSLQGAELENFGTLERRLLGFESRWAVRGRVDGLVTLRGPWKDREYGGYLTARGVELRTPAGVFPVRGVAVRISGNEAQFAKPASIELAPRLVLRAWASLERRPGAAPSFEIRLNAPAVPLAQVLPLARGAGVGSLDGVTAEGDADVTAHLGGVLWPVTRPSLAVEAELHNAQFGFQGISQNLKIRRASLRLDEREIVAGPLVAVMGSTAITGRVWRERLPGAPWSFDLTANKVDAAYLVATASAVAARPPRSFFWWIPGISLFVHRRAGAAPLLRNLNARGRIQIHLLKYRAIALHQVEAVADIRDRRIRLSSVVFRAGGGRGTASFAVNLGLAPAVFRARLALDDAAVEPLRPYLAPALGGVRGRYNLIARLDSRGQTPRQLENNLRGSGSVKLREVSFGRFNPLAALKARVRTVALNSAARAPELKALDAQFKIAGSRIIILPCAFTLASARLRLAGDYDFGRGMDVKVDAFLPHRVALTGRGPSRLGATLEPYEVRLRGPLARPVVSPAIRLSDAQP